MIIKTAIFHGGELHGQTRDIRFDDAGMRIRDDASGKPYARIENCKCGLKYDIHFKSVARPASEVF